MESSEFLATVRTMHAEARRRGLFFQTLESERVEGRSFQLHGRDCLAFTSCSYVGLERHPKLIAAVHDYVERFGTQFSASRGYISLGAHAELEASLDRIFDGHTILATSTTLAHQIALPVLATERDAIVLDHQVHTSVHMAATLARAAGTQVEIVRHGRLADAVPLIQRLARTKRTVWFACDGVFSMFGDLAPIGLLRELVDIAPNVCLYIDDAHGMSWAGRHGRGSFLSRMPMHERLVVATSLNKAFSASGGCVVVPSAEMRDAIRLAAGPIVFSGPLQPPMLGAALASAEIHLSDEIRSRQDELAARVVHCNERLERLRLPLLAYNESPIFFLQCGLPRVAFQVAERLLEQGVYVTPAVYPAVPMKTAGIRLTLTTEHSFADIDRVCDALSEAIPWAMERERLSVEELDQAFVEVIPPESRRSEATSVRGCASERFLTLCYAAPESGQSVEAVKASDAPAELGVEVTRTIRAIDRDLWDRLLGTLSCSSWEALSMAEEVFRGNAAPEHDWSFFYVIVRDGAGEVVAATYFTVALHKDDMLMRAEISSAIEAHRRTDPYLLTSRVVSMGSNFSEGSHLFLDRRGPWRAALARILEVAFAEYAATGAGVLLLRDFREDDVEVGAFLLESGFVRVPMLDSHLLDITWKTPAEFEARLPRRRLRQLREVKARTPSYERRIVPSDSSPAVRDELFQLYCNVADRKLRLNTFRLPRAILDGLLRSPAWEVVSLHLTPEAGGPEDGTPVAWYGAHRSGAHYMPLLCGLDYRYVHTHGAYRQLLYQIILRAEELKAERIHLGMDANFEKERFRTSKVPTCAYVFTRDDFIGARMREMVAEVALGTASKRGQGGRS